MPKSTSDQDQAKVNKLERILRHLSPFPPSAGRNQII